jgi:hypothetical protein
MISHDLPEDGLARISGYLHTNKQTLLADSGVRTWIFDDRIIGEIVWTPILPGKNDIRMAAAAAPPMQPTAAGADIRPAVIRPANMRPAPGGAYMGPATAAADMRPAPAGADMRPAMAAADMRPAPAGAARGMRPAAAAGVDMRPSTAADMRPAAAAAKILARYLPTWAQVPCASLLIVRA